MPRRSSKKGEFGRPKVSLGWQKRKLLARIQRQMKGKPSKRPTIGSSILLERIVTAIPAVSKVYLLDFDFVPTPPSPNSSQAGMTGYDINWPGPPRRKINWADLRFYKPMVQTRDPTPVDIGFSFSAYDDVTGWFDTELAFFTTIIRSGNTTPTDSDIVCLSAVGDAKAPISAPYSSTGGFWLGATIRGNVKGNAGKNGRDANVYLANTDLIYFPTGVSVPVGRASDESPRHKVRAL